MYPYLENCNKTSPVSTNRYAHADSGVCKLEPACEARVTLRTCVSSPPVPTPQAYATHPCWRCIPHPNLVHSNPWFDSHPWVHSTLALSRRQSHTCRTRVRRQGQRHQLSRCCQRCISCGSNFTWSRGVTVSTLDSESGDRGANPRGTSRSLAQASIRT